MPALVKKKAKLRYGAPSKPREPAPKPLTFTERIALLVGIDDAINELKAKLKALGETYESAETALLEAMQTEGMTSAKSDKASVSISRREAIGIDAEQWHLFCEYVRKNNAFDLVQRRVTQQAVKDREAEGEKVPGIKRTTLVGLTLTRVKVKS